MSAAPQPGSVPAPPTAPAVLPAPRRRAGPLLLPQTVRDTKDPCPVFDGERWHLYGSAGSVVVETWRLLHASARHLGGPWTELPPVELQAVRSDRVAAPGVVHDRQRFHMFVQTDFLGVGGTIEHLVSEDGQAYERADTALASVPGTPESGVFDAHPAVVGGRLLLTYAAMASDLTGLRFDWTTHATRVRGPDVFLAESRSGTWDGPWERRGRILAQEEVPFHVAPGQEGYEWGLEGPQLLELPDGHVLLTAVAFVPGRRGTRQRVFLARSRSPDGPYEVLGPTLEPEGDGWESGEVGHATAVVDGDDICITYQARAARPREGDDGEARWRCGVACWPLPDFVRAVAEADGAGAR